MEAIHNDDKKVVEGIMKFPWEPKEVHGDIHKTIHKEATGGLNKPNVSMVGVGPYDLRGLNPTEGAAIGVGVLLGMIGIAHYSNKRQLAKKTIEFDVNHDLELAPKESKKAVKKALKDIMKKSTTKTTLMDN